MVDIIDTTYKFIEGDSENRKLVIERHQEIPDDHLKALADQRLASSSAPTGNFMKLCSIPTSVVEKWLREGFDIYKEPAKAIVARLKMEDLNAFMATNKTF